jgi:asparagine synthase (glutamine-hydrolysing)
MERSELFQRAVRRISHRGDPELQAEHINAARFVTGTNRMRITSRIEGIQPIVSQDGRITLSFNGEIYNYKQLSAQYQLTSEIATVGVNDGLKTNIFAG